MNNDNGQKNDESAKKLQDTSRRGMNMATANSFNRVRNMSTGNRPIRQMDENVSEKLGNNQIVKNQLADRTNNIQRKNISHERPNLGVQNKTDETKSSNLKNKDVGSRNLRNSLNNKAKNMWQQRHKKKERQEASDGESTSENETSSFNPLDEVAGAIKRRIKIKIIIYGTLIGIALLIAGTILMALFGVNIAQTVPAISPNNYETDNFQPTYEEGTEEYKDEINYYKKLKETVEKYENETGDELKLNYIHAPLIYLYYKIDNGEISSNDNLAIDYKKMTEMIDVIVPLMTPSDESKTIDYEIDGDFYNNLKDSKEFKDYYEEVLKTKKIDELLDEIFNLAKELDEMVSVDDTVITTETTVTVTESSSNNKTTTKTMSLNSYILGSLYANSVNINNSELVKAYTIAYSTNVVANNKSLTIDSNSASINGSTCSVEKGCSYDKNGNLVDGPGERSDKNTIFYNGKYYYKLPLTSSEISDLNTSVNSVFGNVLVKSDGTYPNLDITKLGGLGDYKSILNSSYGSDYTIKNIGEDSYIVDGSYGTTMVKTNVIFYDQGDYASNSFCGLKNETIKSSGCGVTSMAMVTSTYENNNKYNPIFMNQEAMNKKMCGAGSGTAQAFFGKEASSMNYKYLGGSKYNKNILNLVLQHLSKGHLVVVRMGPGHFTGGGHYMVLGGVDPSTKKVYVYDPNNKSNSNWRKTGNGWYSFNDIIVKEAYNFYIIWKG